MDPGLPKYPRVPRGTLDNLVTCEKHAPAPLAHVALGQCAMGSLRRTVGKASPTVSAMRTTSRHYRASAPRFLPSLAALFHQPLDPLLGRVAPTGPRLATYNDHQRPQAGVLSPHPQQLHCHNPPQGYGTNPVSGGMVSVPYPVGSHGTTRHTTHATVRPRATHYCLHIHQSVVWKTPRSDHPT